MAGLLVERTARTDLPPIQPLAPSGRSRLDSIDLLRGLVIVLMALDHVKGHFANFTFDPIDVSQTYPAAFLTRWITHFCAPTFVFLAGTGAFLYGARGKTKNQVAWFLLSRGLWLIVLELTVIRYSWFLNWNYGISVGQVIWAIGWSMIVLSVLQYFPTSAVAVFGLGMIAFHNLADRISAADWGRYDWAWKILHTGEPITFTPLPEWLQPIQKQLGLAEVMTINPFYALIPWMGVLAAGYAFGAMYLMEPRRRRQELFGLGLALTLLFIALRFSNAYGDKPSGQIGHAGPWSVQTNANGEKDWLFTIFSFINCQKYPPSLCFLLMTLGPAIVALALFERPMGMIGNFFIVFGRVPLFFYLLHWYVIKALFLANFQWRFGRYDWIMGNGQPPGGPEVTGYPLWAVYLIWLFVVFLLFPLCYWFARVKQRSRSAWLSYL